MKNYIFKGIICFFLLLFLLLNSQVRINDSNCFKISAETETLFYGYPNNFLISNNTNYNYLINIYGFMGSSIIYENEKILFPSKPGFTSNPVEWDEEECKKNILIVPKHKTVKTVLHLDIIRDFYELNSDKKYTVNFESTHTSRSLYYYGCEKYVDSLIKKGYIPYEGILKDKLKLISKKQF